MPTTRFAPSPTGHLHLGHAFSALFAQRSAAGGRFLLRIEDIDASRCRGEYVESIYEDLEWLGLSWERPVRVQSEHFDEYSMALDRLAEGGLLYPCFCTRSDIRRATLAPHGPEGPLYPGTCRQLDDQQRRARIDAGEPYALRLDMGEACARLSGLSWVDRGLGTIVARPQDFGDVVLARKDFPASYHLCVTLDDARQGVELVTRGDDLVGLTHVHRLLQALLGLPTPEYWHHRLITDAQGQRLSKREGATTLRSLREEGWSARRLCDHLAGLL